MISEEILNSIECSIPHYCAKENNESKKCARCLIGYEFIVMEPESLKCGHNICKECVTKSPKGSIKCKFCKEERDPTGVKGTAAEVLINIHLDPLVIELKDKYKKAFTIYDGIY